MLLPRPGIRLDLNGVVKAAAVDAALPLAGDGGFVSAGGDVATAQPLDVAVPRGALVRLVRFLVFALGATLALLRLP